MGCILDGNCNYKCLKDMATIVLTHYYPFCVHAQPGIIAVVWSVILSVSLLGGLVNIRSACIESWLAFISDEIEPVF